MMILGFGSSETKTAIAIINECFEAIDKRGDDDSIESILVTIKQKYHNLDNKYKTNKYANAPERYTYFWFSLDEIHSDRYYVNCGDRYYVNFRFHHVNTKHPMSPDGVALLQTNWILSYCETYGKLIYSEV